MTYREEAYLWIDRRYSLRVLIPQTTFSEPMGCTDGKFDRQWEPESSLLASRVDHYSCVFCAGKLFG